VPYLSASAVVIHYEDALYQMYGPLPLPFTLKLFDSLRLSLNTDPTCISISEVTTVWRYTNSIIIIIIIKHKLKIVAYNPILQTIYVVET